MKSLPARSRRLASPRHDNRPRQAPSPAAASPPWGLSRWVLPRSVLSRCALLLGCALLMSCFGRPVAAHPYHVSLAEVEFNAARRRLEVALQVHPFDLEKELQARQGEPVDLERTPRIDRRLADYLEDAFRVRTEDRQPCELKWVGKQVTLKDAWLYFEVALPPGAERIRLSNRVLFESQEAQANTVHLRVGDRRWSVRCTPTDADHWIPLQ